MLRYRAPLENGALIAAALAGGVFVGLLLGASYAGAAASTPAQDSTAIMQLQQRMNSLRLELSNRMSTLEIDVDRLERQFLDVQNRLMPMENDLRQLAMTPQPPSSRARASGAQRVVPQDTAEGSELRLYDSAGNLRVLISASPEKGELVLYDSQGNELFRR
jgi:TolA-binding protein